MTVSAAAFVFRSAHTTRNTPAAALTKPTVNAAVLTAESALPWFAVLTSLALLVGPGLEARVAFVTTLGATVEPEPLESAAAECAVAAAIERGAVG